MAKKNNKNPKAEDAKMEQAKEEIKAEQTAEETVETEQTADLEAENEKLISENKTLSESCAEAQEKYLRLAAEYDNFRKRSVKEKESLFADGFAKAISGILPIIDNVERAASFATDESEVSKGIQMLEKQCMDALAKLGVTPMETNGKEFNPEFHNAIMHEEDDSENKNIIVETFQKGYVMGDKVIRFAMVKVLN
jgi:molecular chaperone GrpE